MKVSIIFTCDVSMGVTCQSEGSRQFQWFVSIGNCALPTNQALQVDFQMFHSGAGS